MPHAPTAEAAGTTVGSHLEGMAGRLTGKDRDAETGLEYLLVDMTVRLRGGF